MSLLLVDLDILVNSFFGPVISGCSPTLQEESHFSPVHGVSGVSCESLLSSLLDSEVLSAFEEQSFEVQIVLVLEHLVEDSSEFFFLLDFTLQNSFLFIYHVLYIV